MRVPDMPMCPKIAAGGISGLFELGLFHPVDTAAKRLMTNRGAIANRTLTTAQGGVTRSSVIFGTEATAWTSRLMSLYPGLGYASVYKVLQKSYKFGTQPVLCEQLRPHINDRVMASAVAGSLVGAGEVVLLPFDVLKIRSQTNPASISGVNSGRSLWQLFAKEGRGLYRGAGWTVARNVPGSFALFGGNSLAKQLMGLDPTMDGQASFLQNTAGSVAGSVSSLWVSQPLDVIKTRLQQGVTTDGGFRVAADLLRTEGPRAFYKGFGTKVAVVAPKMVFGMTVAQTIMGWFSQI